MNADLNEYFLVREGRLELPLCRQSWILSPVRLPVPPLSLYFNKEIGACDLSKYTPQDTQNHDEFRGLNLCPTRLNFSIKN